MPGLIALAGGAEFQKGMEGADKFLLEKAGGPEAAVVILPTAGGADGGEGIAARNGVNWFSHLGGRNVEAVMVIDRATANDPLLAKQLEQANLIYAAGGSPGFLLQSLKGSLAWEAVLAARERGAILAGSSAGAMVLTREMYNPSKGELERGFGLVETGPVMPHFNGFGRRWLEKIKSLAPEAVLLGIDEKTAMIGSGNDWRVYGKGWVTVFREGKPYKYVSGQPFKIIVA